jgi:Protein of unknown function (DUF1236)
MEEQMDGKRSDNARRSRWFRYDFGRSNYTAFVVGIVAVCALITALYVALYDQYPAGPDTDVRERSQTRTIAAKDRQNTKEIRCNSDIATVRSPLLTLSMDQCLLIGREIPIAPETLNDDQRQSAFEAMASATRLGKRAPSTVDLLALPASVTDKFPDLSSYRYFVVRDDIALVEPTESLIVALVEVHTRPIRDN